MSEPVRIVAFASGSGRTIANFQDRIEAGSLDAEVRLVITNRDCSAVERLRARGITVEIVPWTKETTPDAYGEQVWPRVDATGADLVCLAGFLRMLPVKDGWHDRIMNIHPALLPRFGGKGMYGHHVHEAVLAAGESESGCTVHFSTDRYDEGPIILQKRVPVLADDTPDTLAARVFEAECDAYPEAIRLFGEGRLTIEDGKVSIR